MLLLLLRSRLPRGAGPCKDGHLPHPLVRSWPACAPRTETHPKRTTLACPAMLLHVRAHAGRNAPAG